MVVLTDDGDICLCRMRAGQVPASQYNASLKH